ncbi:MAG: alpha/beta fold hydrolase [Chloroflexota bacterium]
MNTESIYKSPAGEREIMALYDTVLRRWPMAYETFRLPTRHGETFIIASGEPSAPPLVLIHGAVSNATSWVGEFPAYSSCFRVYAVDLPGEPGKSAQNRPAWHGPAFAEWLEDILNGLKIQKTALLGISQGGWTALRFATSHPNRVSKLVLLAPGGIMPARTSFILKSIFYSMFSRRGGEKINQMVIGKDDIHPEAVKTMDAFMTHFKPRVEKEYIFTDDELKRLDMPVLLLGGTDDVICAVEMVAERLKKIVPHLETILFPGVGHVLVNMSGHVLPFLTR